MIENTKSKKQILKSGKGYLNPRLVRAITFYIIAACVVLSVFVCILAIWDFAKTDTLWRLIATLAVIALGSAIFAFINNIFVTEE